MKFTKWQLFFAFLPLVAGVGTAVHAHCPASLVVLVAAIGAFAALQHLCVAIQFQESSGQ